MKKKQNLTWLLFLAGIFLVAGLVLLFKYGLVGQSWMWTPNMGFNGSSLSVEQQKAEGLVYCQKSLLEVTYSSPKDVEPYYVHGTFPEHFFICKSYNSYGGYGVYVSEELHSSTDSYLQSRLMQEVDMHAEISSKLGYCPVNNKSLARLYGVGACKVAVVEVMVANISGGNLSVDERAELISKLNYDLASQGFLIESLNLDAKEKAELINALNLKLEEQDVLISGMGLTDSREKEISGLVAELQLLNESNSGVILQLEEKKSAMEREIMFKNALIGVLVLVLIIMGVMFFMNRGKKR